MTDAALLDLADRAARCILGRRPWAWTAEDWEDALQEAAAGVLDELRRHPDAHIGSLFMAATNEIRDWQRVWLRHRRGGTLLDYKDYAADVERSASAITLDRIQQLAPALTWARQRISAATPGRVDRDIHFLWLMVKGYSIDGAALELGLSRRNTYAIREQLLPRLARLAQEQAS